MSQSAVAAKAGGAKRRMERRLLPVNAWIALHKGELGWPARLREQGFEIHRFEVPVTVDLGTVTIDATSIRRDPATVLSAEGKSGASISNEQARRYGQVRPGHIGRVVTLPFRHEDAAHEVVYAVTLEGREGVRVDLDRLGLGFPLLVVGDSQVRLEPEGSTAVSAFDDRVPGPPATYVPIDDQSPEEELVEHLLPGLMAAASRGEDFVSVETLLRGVMPMWDLYGSSAKATIIRKSRDALARRIQKDLRANFAFEGGGTAGSPVVRILNSPVGYDPRGQTQSWQRLQRKAAKALGRPRRTEAPGQATLFEDLGLSVDQP